MKLQLVPFDGEGNLLSYTNQEVGTDYRDPKYADYCTLWRPAAPFHAALRLIRLERGRSAARFIWKDEATGAEYPMFGQMLVDSLSRGYVLMGVTKGYWEFVKRGANYGIKLA